MPLDKMGRAILDHLGRDARMSWQALGLQVHLTGQAVAPCGVKSILVRARPAC